MLSFDQANEEIKSIISAGSRNNRRVLELWHESIKIHPSKIGYDVAQILEQVLIAALDCCEPNVAFDCIITLKKLFPDSARVSRLYAMCLEHAGKFSNAQKIYDLLIEIDPTNTLARKRLIAIHKAKLNFADAIDSLSKYLKFFMTDYDAWCELGDLYLKVGDYKHAAFCLEEVILSDPDNYMYHLKYADIKYTEGGSENIEIARAYYCKACTLNPNSIRALYGLILTCSSLMGPSASKPMLTALNQAMANQSSTDALATSGIYNQNTTSVLSKDKRDYEKLACWAVKRINKIYSNKEKPTKSSENSEDMPIKMPDTLVEKLKNLSLVNDDVKLGNTSKVSDKKFEEFDNDRLYQYFIKVLQKMKENAVSSQPSSTPQNRNQRVKSGTNQKMQSLPRERRNSSSDDKELTPSESESDASCDKSRART